MEVNILHLIIGVAILLNLLVTVYLLKKDDLESFQKGAQIIIVWMIPFLAAIGIWYFHRSDELEAKKYKEFGGGTHDNSATRTGGEP